MTTPIDKLVETARMGYDNGYRVLAHWGCFPGDRSRGMLKPHEGQGVW